MSIRTVLTLTPATVSTGQPAYAVEKRGINLGWVARRADGLYAPWGITTRPGHVEPLDAAASLDSMLFWCRDCGVPEMTGLCDACRAVRPRCECGSGLAREGDGCCYACWTVEAA